MIAASRLRKSYGSTAVLEDVSLDLAAGQCLALLGPNGAGKTTILRILATLLRPTSGSLALAGVDALKEPEAARALIGVVGPRILHLRRPLRARELALLDGDGGR